MPESCTHQTESKKPVLVPTTMKKIGSATYIVSARFNGDKNRDVVKSIARLIETDALPGDFPKSTT